jgi:hypothetical protein
MGDNGRPLERLIERQRQELGDNVERLAGKARAVTDWRAQVAARPLQMMAIAAGGGAVLALLAGRQRAQRWPRQAMDEEPRRPTSVRVLAGDIRSAVRGVAVAAALELLRNAMREFGGRSVRRTERLRMSPIRTES